MEPFFNFCSAVIYAATQIRIEYQAWQSYRRTLSPRTGNFDSSPTEQRRFITEATL
jgi:hypothetical protein